MNAIKNMFTNLVESVRYLTTAKPRIEALKEELAALEAGVEEHTAAAMAAVRGAGAVSINGVLVRIKQEKARGGGALGYKQLITALEAYDADMGRIAKDEADKLMAKRKADSAKLVDVLVLEPVTPEVSAPRLSVVDGQAVLTA